MMDDLKAPLLDSHQEDKKSCIQEHGQKDCSYKKGDDGGRVIEFFHVSFGGSSSSRSKSGLSQQDQALQLQQRRRQRQKMARVLLHVLVVPAYLIMELYSIQCPYLGLYLPVLYYSAIGYAALPVELFMICTVLIVAIHRLRLMIMGDHTNTDTDTNDEGVESAYGVLLVLAAVMTSLVGWKKFQQMQMMQLEHARKKHDSDSDDDDDHDISSSSSKRAPVAPGPELDVLRLAETRRRRERKQEREQKDRNIATYVGIPLENFDVIV